MRLWRHKNGYFYVLHGPRLQRRISAGTKDRREAERYLAQHIAGAQEPTIGEPTVRAILDGYQADHGPTLRSPGALKYGCEALIRGLGDLKPAHLTPTVMKRYAAQREAKAGTILREIGILRAATGWAANHGLIPARRAIPSPVQAPQPRQRWITKDEARRLLASCHEPHMRLFVSLAVFTVARAGAIFEAKWDQIDWERKAIDYGQGHGNKRRAQVPLNQEALAALNLAKQLACTPYLVEYRGKRITTVKTGFAAACKRAGLVDVTPHILRHSGATWMAMEGISLRKIADMLGDSEATVERVYRKWTPEFLADAAAALQLGPGP